MDRIEIEKISLNIGTGEPGDRLEKAMKLLKSITGAKPVQTITNKRIPTWKVRPGLAIGCKVTIRGQKAKELLIRLLQSKRNKLDKKNFDLQGNFSFGIIDYLEIPGMQYDADVGIIGLEAMVTLKRPGYRIKRRPKERKKIPAKKKITKENAMDYVQKEFNVELGE